MLKKRSVIIACLLLLIPALLLGIGALTLLHQQKQNLLNRTQATATDRALAIAGNIDLAIGEVQDGLLQTLRQIPPHDRLNALERWKRTNPLVRNVFIWNRSNGLSHPRPDQPTSDEEASFVRRYQTLFSDSSWTPPQADQNSTVTQPDSSALYVSRQKLRRLATQPVAESEQAQSTPAENFTNNVESGWLHWFADNHLHLLGWHEPDSENVRIGVEIEMMALLGRLLNNIPANPPSNESYRLIDGNGDDFHQTGNIQNTMDTPPLATVGLVSLPHWQVTISSDGSNDSDTESLMLLSSLLVGSFVICIVAGGGLLLWQAWRNSREALQKTSFVSNVSHELKTPLTTIRMYAEMISEQSDLGDRTSNYLQIIVKESQRLTRLVNNVLDFSRLEQGYKKYHCENIDLTELLHHLLDNQLLRINDAGMQLHRQLPDDPVRLQSDRDALEQIILNLLDNAIKYAASGQTIIVELNSTEDILQLTISDRGPGIDKVQIDKIFNKFHRIDDRLTAKQQGAGLGLSIARQLAEGLGGKLNCRNNHAAGACFVLSLPSSGEEK